MKSMGSYFYKEDYDRSMLIIKSLEERISNLEKEKKEKEFNKKIRVKKPLSLNIRNQIKNYNFSSNTTKKKVEKKKAPEANGLLHELSKAIKERRCFIDCEDALYTDFSTTLNEIETFV